MSACLEESHKKTRSAGRTQIAECNKTSLFFEGPKNAQNLARISGLFPTNLITRIQPGKRSQDLDLTEILIETTSIELHPSRTKDKYQGFNMKLQSS